MLPAMDVWHTGVTPFLPPVQESVRRDPSSGMSPSLTSAAWDAPCFQGQLLDPSSTRCRHLPLLGMCPHTCLCPGQCCPRPLCLMLHVFVSSSVFGNMPRSAFNVPECLAQSSSTVSFQNMLNLIASFAMRKILFLFHNLGLKLCVQKKWKPWVQ